MAAAPSSFQKQLLRWLAEGKVPTREVRYASTSWWMGDMSVTRDMNRLRKMGLIRTWRDLARNEFVELTQAGWEYLA